MLTIIRKRVEMYLDSHSIAFHTKSSKNTSTTAGMIGSEASDEGTGLEGGRSKQRIPHRSARTI